MTKVVGEKESAEVEEAEVEEGEGVEETALQQRALRAAAGGCLHAGPPTDAVAAAAAAERRVAAPWHVYVGVPSVRSVDGGVVALSWSEAGCLTRKEARWTRSSASSSFECRCPRGPRL